MQYDARQSTTRYETGHCIYTYRELLVPGVRRRRRARRSRREAAYTQSITGIAIATRSHLTLQHATHPRANRLLRETVPCVIDAWTSDIGFVWSRVFVCVQTRPEANQYDAIAFSRERSEYCIGRPVQARQNGTPWCWCEPSESLKTTTCGVRPARDELGSA